MTPLDDKGASRLVGCSIRQLVRLIDRSREALIAPPCWNVGLGVRASRRHAIRKGFVTGLLALGASSDAVEVLVGHQLEAVRNAYVDQERALNLRSVVELLPPLDGVTSAPAYRARERHGNTGLPYQAATDRSGRENGETDAAKAHPKAPPLPSR